MTNLRHVGDGNHSPGHGDLHVPRDLEPRLVEAGESAAGVCRFELRERVVLIAFLDPIDAVQILGKWSVISDLQRCLPLRQRAIEVQHQLGGVLAAFGEA
jgi:hypothetical protein